jgi:pyruvate/2-oxoglutarate dehydrogenase complex dihydrolipoamide dehydrogenase (E3) component
MTEQSYDVVVIGSGPGGEGAAMQAVKGGRSVAIVERYSQVGGGCTHWNTIPSKALRYAVWFTAELRANPLLRRMVDRSPLPTFGDLTRSAASVIRQQAEMRRGFYERNNVEIVQGHARFVDQHTIEVQADDEKPAKLLRANVFVIATGSRPYHPPDLDFGHPRVVDSDTILQLQQTPRTMLIYGAGVVGCEYASLFRNLEVKVNLVNTRSRLLSYLDDEVTDALGYHLRDQGVLIRHDETCTRVELGGDACTWLRARRCALTCCSGPTGGPATRSGSAWRTLACRPTSAATCWSTKTTRRSARTSMPSATSSVRQRWPALPMTRGASLPGTSSMGAATPSCLICCPPESTPARRLAAWGRPSAS